MREKNKKTWKVWHTEAGLTWGWPFQDRNSRQENVRKICLQYALLPLDATKSYTWTFEALHTSPFFTEQPFKVLRTGTWNSAALLTSRNDRPTSCFDTTQHIETPRASYDCWGIHRPRPPPPRPHHPTILWDSEVSLQDRLQLWPQTVGWSLQ